MEVSQDFRQSAARSGAIPEEGRDPRDDAHDGR
jgi:hypothetical protein